MKKWKPAPENAVAAFADASAGLERIEPRKMFGYSCLFANGHMFAGLHQEGMVLKLQDIDRTEFIDRYGATPFEPMPGRVMREYVVVPPGLLSKSRELRDWIERARSYVESLPPKAGKGKAGRRPVAGSKTSKKGGVR